MRRQMTSLALFVAVLVSGGCMPSASSNPGGTPATASVPVTPPNAQPIPTGPPGDLTDQTGLQMIHKLADYYKSLNRVACEIETTVSGLNLPAAGAATAMATTVTFEKPDRMAFRPVAGNGIEIVSNANESTIALGQLKKYTQGPTLGTFADFATKLANFQMAGMGPTFATALMAFDPYEAIMNGVTKTTLVGVEKIDGVSANHVRFEQPNMNWSLWSAADGEPLVLKTSFEIPFALPGAPAQNMTHTAFYRKWKSNPSITEATFSYHAPKDFQNADDIAGLFGGDMPGGLLDGLFGGAGTSLNSDSSTTSEKK